MLELKHEKMFRPLISHDFYESVTERQSERQTDKRTDKTSYCQFVRYAVTRLRGNAVASPVFSCLRYNGSTLNVLCSAAEFLTQSALQSKCTIIHFDGLNANESGKKYGIFSRVLRDSTPRFVGRSVGWSVGWSVGLSFFTFLFFVVFF